MCPDRELLSALADGEVPEPWKGRLSRHVEQCPACAKTVEGYLSVSRALRSMKAPSVDSSRLEAMREAVLSRSAPARRRDAALAAFAGKRIGLPLPAAAAVAAVFVGLAWMAFSGRIDAERWKAIAEAKSQDIQAAQIVPASMEEIIRYVERYDPRSTMAVSLPGGASRTVGQPIFVTDTEEPAFDHAQGEILP